MQTTRQEPARGGRSPAAHRNGQGYDDDNRGCLFWKDTKETDKHPDATGFIVVNGRKFELAAWSRRSESGKDYLSLKISKEVF